MLRAVLGLAAVAMAWCAAPAFADDTRTNRLIVLTDIENEPDDTMSMVRLMLYTNEIELEGLIATTSTHMRGRIAPDAIRAIINRYALVQPNLVLHDRRYPRAAALLALVKSGQPHYGIADVGAGHDSEGSDWIIHILEENDDRPLWISVWGGANTLAQALTKIRATRTPAEVARLIVKLRVYTISDQHDSGIWIRREFPDLFYIVSPGGYGAASWVGIMEAVDGLANEEISNAWIAAHIQQGHGPLGAAYPDVAYGMEGDTPSWLGLIPNGLSDYEHPNWGGWGGRYELYTPERANEDVNGFNGHVPIEDEPRPIWTNARDRYTPYAPNSFGRAVRASDKTFEGFRVGVWRWRVDFQNDFAARIAWTTEPVASANHPPIPALAHPRTLTVHGGDRVWLDASGTRDPDGDSLSYLWFNYPEAGTLAAPIPVDGAENIFRVSFVAPEVTRPETAHFILRVTDKGSPPLSRYERVIVTILPR
ncbi:MAG: nucleoside hydrolase-like domain-containing protein [Pseudomonadota bacterium]